MAISIVEKTPPAAAHGRALRAFAIRFRQKRPDVNLHVINPRHKGVPTDVVDRHLLTMRESEGPALIEREGERNYQRARATKLTDLLNSDPESPWRGGVRRPGERLGPP